MLLRLRHLWDHLRFSYWFVPSLMTFGAVLLAALTLVLDTQPSLKWAEWVPWLFMDQPDGARDLLSTIAGSMITVAGVTFSITIAALAYATSQFGPRLLTNFMEDRGNQVTLGTFVATYLYSLLILRAIRAGDEATPAASGSDGLSEAASGQAEVATEAAAQAAGASPETAQAAADALSAFVPHFSILTALLLAVGSLGVLIFYIHHAPASIHASNVAAYIGRDLIAKIGRIFPEGIGADLHDARSQPDASRGSLEPGHEGGAALGTADAETRDADAHPSEYEPAPDDALPPRFHDEAVVVRGDTDGYLQQIDGQRLIDLAEEHDVLLRLHVAPGAFAWGGMPLVAVWPSQNATDALLEAIPRAFAWGRKRSVTQDVMFLVDELVEVAARALSPGINDPVTAMTCSNWLAASAARLGQRAMPSAYRYDARGALRIVATPITYAAFIEAAFGQLRPYFESDENAALHLMRRYAELVPAARERRQAVLQEHADALLSGARAQKLHPRALAQIEQAHRQVGRAALSA